MGCLTYKYRKKYPNARKESIPYDHAKDQCSTQSKDQNFKLLRNEMTRVMTKVSYPVTLSVASSFCAYASVGVDASSSTSHAF